jgi:quinol monooxygenase YgiN
LAEAAEIDVATYQGRMSTMAAGNTHLQRDTYRTAVELIRLLQERDIRVVFYTPPYYESYVELSDPAMIEEMKQIMSGLQQEYGVEYYDLSADEELISDSRLFLNSDHLNLCGARVFSTRLNELMESHNR